jgi:hypothetical protein
MNFLLRNFYGNAGHQCLMPLILAYKSIPEILANFSRHRVAGEGSLLDAAGPQLVNVSSLLARINTSLQKITQPLQPTPARWG